MSGRPIPADIDSLFKVPLAEFTAARNALAAKLRSDGQQAKASEAKALTKPSVSAWVVNQLYWRHRVSFDRLIQAGAQLRRAQRTGGAARDAIDARRAALNELAALAADVLRDENHVASRDLLRRVTTTLEALSSHGSTPGAPVAGRLTDDMEPPGFEALAGLLPQKTAPTAGPSAARKAQPAPAKRATQQDAPRRDEERRKRLVAEAKTGVRDADRALQAARKAAQHAAAKRTTEERRANELESERTRLETRLARLTKDADAARARAAEAAVAADEAARSVEAAERGLEAERRRWQSL